MSTKHSPEALRDARNKRLAAAEGTKQSPAPTSTPAPAPVAAAPKPEATPKAAAAAPPPAPAPTQAPPRELVAKVADPSKVGTETKITLAGPYNANTDNPHWVVFADGEPFAKIALADQQEPDKIRKLFATEGYASSFLDTLKKVPLSNLLSTAKARYYVAAVKSTEAFAAIDAKYKADAKAEMQNKAARYRDDFLTMVNLVVEAQRKNYLTDNPLKDSLFKHLKSAGVQNPVQVIENAFVEAAGPHFESIVKKVQQWMDFSPEALADIKQAITEMPVRPVTAAVAPLGTRITEPQAPVPSSRGNVPVVPTNIGDTKVASATEKEQAKGVFNFRGRMKGNMMPQNG